MTVLFLAEVRKRRKNRGERGGRQVVCIVCGIVLFNQLNDHLCCYMFARVDKLEEPSTKTPPKKVCPDLCMNLKQARNLHGIIIQTTQWTHFHHTCVNYLLLQYLDLKGSARVCLRCRSATVQVKNVKCPLRSRQTVLLLSQTMRNKCKHLAE